MSMTFTKLFSSITESTIWVAPDAYRLCWITMLAMADRQGRVWASIPGLANRARISVDDCRAAIAFFLAPDVDSRTKDHDGRRIEEIDGGWKLLNHAKYRAIRDEEAILEAKRKYINTRRAVENVDRSRAIAEAEAEAEKKKEKELAGASLKARPASPNNSPILQTLPLRNGGEFAVSQAFVDQLVPLYPAVDIQATINEMKGWLIGNPHKRKTMRGVKSFITRWLHQEQEKANGV